MSLSEEDENEIRDEYKEAAEESGEKIRASHIFLAPFTENYIKDPLCMIQLGIAVSLDKPIYILFEPGVKIPRHLLRIADGWEQIKDNTPQARADAAERLMTKVKKNLENDK